MIFLCIDRCRIDIFLLPHNQEKALAHVIFARYRIMPTLKQQSKNDGQFKLEQEIHQPETRDKNSKSQKRNAKKKKKKIEQMRENQEIELNTNIKTIVDRK